MSFIPDQYQKQIGFYSGPQKPNLY